MNNLRQYPIISILKLFLITYFLNKFIDRIIYTAEPSEQTLGVTTYRLNLH